MLLPVTNIGLAKYFNSFFFALFFKHVKQYFYYLYARDIIRNAYHIILKILSEFVTRI